MPRYDVAYNNLPLIEPNTLGHFMLVRADQYDDVSYANTGYANAGYADTGYADNGHDDSGYADSGYAKTGYADAGYAEYAEDGYPVYADVGGDNDYYAAGYYSQPLELDR